MNTFAFDLDKLMITEDSFGSDLPRNWEAIAARLNTEIFDRIVTAGIEDPQEAYEIASSIWEDYCNNSDEEEEEEKEMESKIWYAVQRDPEDDWGTGSYDYDEAMGMLNEQGYGLIAVIEETDADKVCIREIPYEEA